MPADLNQHLARARSLARAGRSEEAAPLIAEFARARLGLDCAKVTLRSDNYSLNSLHGVVELATPFAGERELFFKYHQEEEEAKGVGEYYNSKLLEAAGLPVDVPLASRTEVGEQILFYKLRRSPRLADVCREIEAGGAPPELEGQIVRAQEELDRQVGGKYLETLHLAAGAEAAGEALHQLFFHRLVDPGAGRPFPPGGRWKAFYLDGEFLFPGLDRPLTWGEVSQLRWNVNGVSYQRTLGELFAESLTVLDPACLPAQTPAVVGHGDAHNANVWAETEADPPRLVMFDPAFAGRHLPALLAEIKATFHNIFAHPEWLYYPEDAATRFSGSARLNGRTLEITHDWALTSLRRAFLETKTRLVWQPLLRALAQRDPAFAGSGWERYLRLALFCCPTLVMNLCAGAQRHNPISSLVGLSIAMMCGSEPEPGQSDDVSDFLERITPR